jgi:hypothetical protein
MGGYFYREFFSLDRNVVINIIQDVSLFVKGQGGVVTEMRLLVLFLIIRKKMSV